LTKFRISAQNRICLWRHACLADSLENVGLWDSSFD